MSSSRNLIRRLFGIDVRSLAIFRVGVASLILADLLLLRFGEVTAFYADDGMFPIADSRALQASPWSWSFHYLDGSAGFQATLFCIAAVFAILLLIGYQTRLATIASWVLAVSLTNRNLPVSNYGDTILILLLFWSMFLPLGATWSVDGWLRWRRGATPAEPQHKIACSVATASAMLQVSIVYFFAALWKMNEDWLSGNAVYHAFHLEYATRPVAVYLAQFSWLMIPLTRATLLLELLGPLLVWVPWRNGFFRRAMIVAFATLHISIEVCFTPLMLSYVCIVAWLLFVPGSVWDSRLLRSVATGAARKLKWPATSPDSSQPETVRRSESGWRPAARYTAGAVCLFFLIYIVLWNVATLDRERLGFLVPARMRCIGHLAMVRQTWDMFYVPSRHNGWFVAQAQLGSGEVVDVLRNGEPVDNEHPRHNWWYLTNPRRKMFFRRLGTEPCASLRSGVAEYLLRTWNEDHTDNRRTVSLNLLYYQWLDSGEDGDRDYTARVVAAVETDGDAQVDALLPMLRTLEDGWPGFP